MTINEKIMWGGTIQKMVNSWIWTTNTSNTTSDTLMYPGEWYEWNGITTTASNTITQYNYWPADVETWRNQQVGGTPEQRQRARELERETRRRRERAKEVAQELLMENLTEEQKHMLKHSRCFHVIGADGKRYEIDTTKQWHNVFRLNPKGEREEEFCIYQSGGTPIGDNHLMQKLIVESDVALLNRVANKRRLLG